MDYNIIINRKKIKNVYIRVDDNGNVVVNANKRVKDKYIYDLLNEKDDWIQKRLKAINNKSEVYDINGRKISIFGKKYIIKVIKDKKNKIELKENYFFLYTKYDDVESMVKLINKYLIELFLNNLNCYIIKECMQEAKIIGIKNDFNIKVRLMKSRFGSYSKKTNSICLNLALMKYDIEIIKSVLYHEICHIKQMNHQKRFYELLYKVCPNYDEYSNYLKRNFNYSNKWFLV